MGLYRSVGPAQPWPPNPILYGLIQNAQKQAARRRRLPAVSTLGIGDKRPVVGWIGDVIKNAPNLETALNCLEAATAAELYEPVGYDEVVMAALGRAWHWYRRRPQRRGFEQAFLRLVCERAFWGPAEQGYGRPVYLETALPQPDWHNQHESVLGDLVTAFMGRQKLFATAAWQNAWNKFFGANTNGPSPSQPFRLGQVWQVTIQNPHELAMMSQGLTSLNREDLPTTQPNTVLHRGLGMFAQGLTYCAMTRDIQNARGVYLDLFGSFDGQLAPVTPEKLQAFVYKLLGSMPPEGFQPGQRAAWTVHVIADLIVNRGNNNLNPQERSNILTYFRLAGDVCLLSDYLRDPRASELTIAQYLDMSRAQFGA